MTDVTFWDDIAQSYAEKPVELPEAFEDKIRHTIAKMEPDHTVLDIGCGTGSLALRLAPSGGHIHGLDVSSQMIRIAREKASEVENVTFHVGAFDPSFDVFPARSLDGICAYSLLHLVTDGAAALARMYEALRPGGFLVTSTPCLGESWVPYRPIITVMRWAGKAPRVEVVTKAWVRQAVRDAGFVDLEEPEVGAKATTTFLMARRPE